MADNSGPGPSGARVLRIKDPKHLTPEELYALAYLSESDEEPFQDSGSEWSGEEEIAEEFAGNSDGGDAPHSNPDDPVDDATNIQQNNDDDIQWVEAPPDLQNISFVGKQELKVPIPGDGKPIDFFYLLTDNDLFDILVRETNIYAEYVLLHEGSGPNSRISRWKPVDRKEMSVFLGISFFMGILQLPRLRDYWRTDRLYNLSVRKYMSRDRYLIILRCWHFATNSGEGDIPPTDRLYKVRPLIDYFNNKIFAIYSPGKNLSIDESMLLWRGRLLFRQYIKNKKHKYGIKFYLLTESSGTVLNMQIYTGVRDELGGKGHASNVVLRLMANYFNKGHSLYMDNFYNSVSLARQLLEKNTYCTGTLRAGRKQTPHEVSKTKLKAGESVHRYGKNVCVGKWMDKRDVLYISTEHENNFEEVTSRSGKCKNKPTPVAQYNRYMSGIDLQDQMLSYYPTHRKTIRWYKKVGFHILDLLLYNSFMMYNQFSGPKMSLLDFRESIIESLLVDNSDKENRNEPKENPHFASKCETGVSGRKLRKRCRWCSQRGIRKDAMYFCKGCPELPGLCLEPCFKEFHDNLN